MSTQKRENELSIFVGKKIREFRKKKGFTQKDLGRMIDKKDNTISNYETGTISPEQDALFALSRALEVSIDDFFPLSDDDKTLDHAISISESNMDLTDMDFLNNLILHAKTLDGDERKRFINNIKLAVEFFDKTNN